jgi:aromatic ring hydroxylase
MPSELDLSNPTIGPLAEKYHGGLNGVTPERRLSVARLVENMVAGPRKIGCTLYARGAARQQRLR